jgi:uncharacterized protein YbaR (Trm112 family)
MINKQNLINIFYCPDCRRELELNNLNLQELILLCPNKQVNIIFNI